MKIVKKILLGLLAVIVLAVLVVAGRFYVLLPNARAATEVKAPNTPEAIERGKYLANHVMVCTGCHSEVDETVPGEPIKPGRTASGREFPPIPGFPGKVRAPNLTPDKETGLGNWTDGEILRAMREGVDKDGRVLFPMMPYTNMGKALSDADALSIIAYLRSLPPIKNAVPTMEVAFPVSMFIRAEPAPVVQPAGPPPTEPVARGEWLIKVCNCHDCHDTMDGQHKLIPGKELAGGGDFPIPGKGMLHVPNITSDKATGIGSYSDEDLMRIFREGKNKAGRSLYGMPWWYYGGMTDDDLKALIAALRKVKPVVNAVPPSEVKG